MRRFSIAVLVVSVVVATATAWAAAPKGSKSNPIPVKTFAKLTYTSASLRVNRTNLDATQVVLAASPRNEPPAQGRQYVLINITLVSRAGYSLTPGTLETIAYDLWVLRGSRVYELFDNICAFPGYLPNDLRAVGGPKRRVTANICYSVRKSDVSRLLHGCALGGPSVPFQKIYFKLR